MKNLENTLHGIRYMNTYLEAGFPRVICNTIENRRMLKKPLALKMRSEGKSWREISIETGFSEMTIRNWVKNE